MTIVMLSSVNVVNHILTSFMPFVMNVTVSIAVFQPKMLLMITSLHTTQSGGLKQSAFMVKNATVLMVDAVSSIMTYLLLISLTMNHFLITCVDLNVRGQVVGVTERSVLMLTYGVVFVF